MKKALPAFAVILGLFASARAASACTPTGFFRDGIEMTAAVMNPTAAVTGQIDATGCNIGVYGDHGTLTVNGSDIFGANYFGVLANADASPMVVHISNNVIHNIGEFPLNGTQHGVAVYLRAFFTSAMTGEVTGNFISGYQKGGIVANGRGTTARIAFNHVVGTGHVNFIAQNGIQIGYGARPTEVSSNNVSGNSYIGTPGDGSASGGILVVGGPGYGTCPDGNDCPYTTNLLIGYSPTAPNNNGTNLLFNNDVGIYVSNLAADGVSTSPNPTSVLVAINFDESDACYNNSYQAGISDQGNTDYIVANYVSAGGGHGSRCGLGIDTTGSVNPQVIGNVAPGSLPTLAAQSVSGSKTRAKLAPEKP